MEGLIGKKIGMTQVWNEKGQLVPVTVIEAGPCPVVQVKTKANDGYDAVQLGFSEQKPQRLTKAARTRFEKANVAAQRVLKEFAADAGEEVKAGDAVGVAIFEGVGLVDVTGVSKGKGFAGVVRRYRFGGGPMTHGGHSKRRPGAMATRDLPGWIQKGKKMPGHMGDVQRKARNLTVVQVRKDDNLLLVQGSIPGANGEIVIVKKALKKVKA